MYNIWNLPSMAGVHLANYLTQFGLRVRLINNLDSEWDWLCEAYRSCARPPLVGLSSTFYRSEEHTSELQSLMRISYAVFCLKKKNNTTLTSLPAQSN